MIIYKVYADSAAMACAKVKCYVAYVPSAGELDSDAIAAATDYFLAHNDRVAVVLRNRIVVITSDCAASHTTASPVMQRLRIERADRDDIRARHARDEAMGERVIGS